jgi:hypothetical protein
MRPLVVMRSHDGPASCFWIISPSTRLWFAPNTFWKLWPVLSGAMDAGTGISQYVVSSRGTASSSNA